MKGEISGNFPSFFLPFPEISCYTALTEHRHIDLHFSYSSMENLFFYTLLFFFGLFWGSFSNVVIFRLHTEEKGILFGKSHCQNCQHELKFWDLFPVFSWVFLGGKCRYCGDKISGQYPLVEFAMGALWVALFWMNGIGIENFLVTGDKALEGIFWMIFGFFWIVMFVADVRWMEVFRYISIPTIVLLSAGVFFLPEKFPEISDAAWGVAIPTVFFGTQYILSKYIFTSRGIWIGEGDFDFGVMIGLLLGWKLAIVALALAYFGGAFVGVAVMRIKGQDAKIAFGPFLLSALLITYFWGEGIMNWYLGLIGVI